MSKIITSLVLLLSCLVGCTTSNPRAILGVYSAATHGSRLELIQGGDFGLEEGGELNLWFPAGSWKIRKDVLMLFVGDEVARYTIDGDKLHLIKKIGAANPFDYAHVSLAMEYTKEPIKSATAQRP